MTEKYEVIDVEAGEFSEGIEGWNVIVRRPDGRVYGHVLPKVVFEWRAAEYGLTNPDEILDVVLHEPYVETDAANPMVSVTHPPAPQMVKKSDGPRLPKLFEAESTVEARAAHRVIIAQTKANRVRVSDPSGLLSYIIANHGMSPAAIQEKREAVDVHRWNRLYGGLPVPVSTDLEVPRA